MAFKRVFRNRPPSHKLAQKAAKALGYKSIGHYLASDLWRSVSARAKLDADHCHCCNAKGSKYAHLIRFDEQTMTGNSMSGVAVLCFYCHWDVKASSGNPGDVVRALRESHSRSPRLAPSEKAVTLHAELGKVPRLPKPAVNELLSGNPGQESDVQIGQVPKA